MGKSASKSRARPAAVGYVRVSSTGQRSGHGFDRQEEDIRAFAKSHPFELQTIYREGHTGAQADRPELARMIEALLMNGCRTVIVASLDRFARDLSVQTSLLSAMAARGISVWSASTGEDITAALSEDPMSRAMIQIQGVFSELDKRLLVSKLARARAAGRASGRKVDGRKAYGEVDAHEREALEQVRALHRRKLTAPEIAERMNQSEFRTRSGRPWNARTIYNLLDTKRVARERIAKRVGGPKH